MEASVSVLMAGGVSILMFGFLLGLPVSSIRAHAPTTPRHLMTAHLTAIMEGTMLLALTQAAMFSTLDATIETVGAVLLVTGCVLDAVGPVANWRQAVDDPFAARSLGWKLQAAGAPLNIAGLAVFVAGVLLAL